MVGEPSHPAPTQKNPAGPGVQSSPIMNEATTRTDVFMSDAAVEQQIFITRQLWIILTNKSCWKHNKRKAIWRLFLGNEPSEKSHHQDRQSVPEHDVTSSESWGIHAKEICLVFSSLTREIRNTSQFWENAFKISSVFSPG